MRIVLFLDLDDTIFQTMPKCPSGEAVHPVAYGRDGTPLSYVTKRQRTFLDMWFRTAVVIPTTARSLDAYRRVDLPFDQFAILDFGGVILLPNGSPDPIWDAHIRPQSQTVANEMVAIQRAIERCIADRHLGANVRIVADYEMPLYVVVKHSAGDASKLRIIHDELLTTLALQRFFVHLNDNNLSIVPAFLGKEHAVKHVVEQHFGTEPILTIGMGDSLTDAPFLSRCDFSIMPQACQLARHRLPFGEGT